MGILRRRPRPATRRLVDPRLGRVTLLAIAEQGCRLQDRAEAVLAETARPGERRAALAREGGHLAGEYHRLFGWASDACGDDDRIHQQRELAQLLMHHCQVLHDAIRLTFPKYHVPDDGRPRGVRVELGPAAHRLRELAAELSGPPARPCP